MSKTNPGNWPDQAQEKLEYCNPCKIWHGEYCPEKAKDKYKRYTGAERLEAYKAGVIAGKALAAADLKAARIETVTKCLLAGLIYLDNPQNADLVYHGGLDGFIATIEKLKEEIENDMSNMW